jgi:hypothetical protein
MSGSLNLNTPSYLSSLYTSSSPGDSLLATLYGQGNPSTGSTNPIAALSQAQTGEKKQVALVAAEPQVARDLALFAKALSTATTPAQLLANPAALKVLLTANGLGAQVSATALATKALLSNPKQPDALANQLPDARWASMAKTYAFATTGLKTLKNPKVLSAVTAGYAEVLWRQNLDQTTPGLSNALDFLKRASTITSPTQVLGDSTFRAVITTALGIPKEIAFQSESTQEAVISRSIELSKFKDPAFVKQFTQQYLVAAAQAAATTPTAATDLITIAAQAGGLLV